MRVYMDYIEKTKEKNPSNHLFFRFFLPFNGYNYNVCPFLKIFTSNRYGVWVSCFALCMYCKCFILCYSHKWKFFFVALMLFADVFSCLKIYYTKHHQISWSCLLSIVPFSLACVIRILIMNKKNDRPLLAADKCDKHF